MPGSWLQLLCNELPILHVGLGVVLSCCGARRFSGFDVKGKYLLMMSVEVLLFFRMEWP